MIYISENRIDDVLEMYKRSIQIHNVQYNPFIGDGDSSAYGMAD